MKVAVMDTWAFLEIVLDGARAGEVRDLVGRSKERVTVGAVVYETFNHLVHRTRTTHYAWEWLEALCASDHRILEPTLEQIHGYAAGQDRSGDLSLTDHAVAWAAERHRERSIVSADGGFRRLGLDPLFAPPQ